VSKFLIDIESEFRLSQRSLLDLSERVIALGKPKDRVQRERKTRGAPAVGFIGVVKRAVSQSNRVGGTSGSKAARGTATARASRDNLQRAAVRVSYTQNRVAGQWAAHGRYISRKSARGVSQPFGSGLESDPSKLLGSWQQAGDARVFKIIISPEFGERMDLEVLTRETMDWLQKRTGRDLEWTAVSHFDTANPHTHLLIRGVDAKGEEFRLPKTVIKRELRDAVRERATYQIGMRTPADRKIALMREAQQYRWTAKDTALMAGQADPAYRQARLAFLQSAGLADDRGINPSAKATLQAIATASDRSRMIRANRPYLSDPSLRVSPGQDMPPVSRVVAIENGVTLLESPRSLHIVRGEVERGLLGKVIGADGRAVSDRYWDQAQGRAIARDLPASHKRNWLGDRDRDRGR
jgi:hypothetical protein